MLASFLTRAQSVFILLTSAAAVVGALALGSDLVQALVLGFAVLAGIPAFLSWNGARRQGADIREVADFSRWQKEEALRSLPNPGVQMLDAITSVPAIEVTISRRRAPVIDADAIVEEQLALARARIPKPRSTAQGLATGSRAVTIADLVITPFQGVARADFDSQLRSYSEDLRQFLVAAQSHLLRRSWQFEIVLSFVNRGGAPARDCEVLVHLPAGIVISDFDDYLASSPPKPPTYREDAWMKPGVDFASLTRSLGVDSFLASPGATHRNVEGPWIGENRAVAHYAIDQLLHNLPLTADDDRRLNLEAPDDGSFFVKWEFHAANLKQHAEGLLSISIVTAADDLPHIRSLAPLEALLEIEA